MLTIKGIYSEAKVFTDNIDPETSKQILTLCNQKFTEGSQIRIMPDTHAGKGCVIGFTANITDVVIPNLIGVDIGCGMLCIELGKMDINFSELDKYIRKAIPSGRSVLSTPHYELIYTLNCYNQIDVEKHRGYFNKSVGTLGGGNHFIEVDKDDEENYYLVIHTGSRNLGKVIAEYYQSLAKETCKEDIPSGLEYLESENLEHYLLDMEFAQIYASMNRMEIARSIFWFLGDDDPDIESISFETVHNYVNTEDMIIRKGAVSAKLGEKLIIPMNMRDGALICTGKGNPDWNFSAPHGAGRILSRSQAKKTLQLQEFSHTMKGIFTTSVNLNTLDESPMAYKPMQEIIDNIGDTVTIDKIIKPVYNFKSGE